MKTRDEIIDNVFRFKGDYPSIFDYRNTTDYDPKNNYLNAILSALVYEEKTVIKKQIDAWSHETPSLGLEHIVQDVGQFRFMVVYNDDYIIVVFRGTDSASNWFVDFEFSMVPFENNENLLVHKGFYDSVLSMRDCLNKIVKEKVNNKQQLYLTGHSLGGAQATIAAFVCEELKGFTNISTYGEPKIGNFDLTASFNKQLNSSPSSKNSRLYRVVNSLDPVTFLPYFYFFNFYYHEGFFYIFSEKEGAKYKIENVGRGIDAPMDVPNQLEGVALATIDTPHSISLYIQNALANVENQIWKKYTS